MAGAGALLIMLSAGCSEPEVAPAPSTPPVVQASSASAATPTSPTATPTSTATPTATATATPRLSPTPDRSTPSRAATPSRTPSGTPFATAETGDAAYGTDLVLTKREVSFTELRWYWGKAAQRRCKKLGIKSELPWCNEYYFENEGKRLEVRLDPDVEIMLLNDDLKLVSASRARLSEAIGESIWPHFRFQMRGDDATRLEQIYTP
jgi:hypothetical protein